MILRDETRYRPYWLTHAISAGNRAGKTLLVSLAVLHHVTFKIGSRPPDPSNTKELDQFNRLPYDWYHFGIQQEIGELLFHSITQILEGTHEAQQRGGCPLVDAFGPIAVTDKKERGEYRWIQIDPVLGGGQIHFRTTAEKGVGSLGKDMHGISFDECGFERNLAFIVNEVLHNRRMSTGGPMFLISTPTEGFSDFHAEWEKGNPESPNRLTDYMSFAMSSRDNIGYGIDKGVFDRLIRGVPDHLVPQNIEGRFVQGRLAFFAARSIDRIFVEGLPEAVPRRRKGRYIQGVDPAAVYDATWSIVLECDAEGRAEGVQGMRKAGKQKVVDVAALVVNTHRAYTGDGAVCETAVDVTGMGGKVFKELLGDIHPFRGVEFGGTKKTKMRMLHDLKALIEQGRLRFPRSGVWLDLRKQLLAYRLDDRKIAQDAVMALCVAVKQFMRSPLEADDYAPFDFFTDADEAEKLNWRQRKREKTANLRRHRLARRLASAQQITRLA